MDNQMTETIQPKQVTVIGVLLIATIAALLTTAQRSADKPPYPASAPAPTSRPIASSLISTRGQSIDTGANHSFVIDHTAVDQFSEIPDSYIQAASELDLLFRHASVGANISDGLNCLMNNFSQRPNFCDAGLPPDQIFYDPKYDRTSWIFEFHSPPPNPNPGWQNKVTYFIDRVNSLGPQEDYDVVGFKFGYVDGVPNSDIDEHFFDTAPSNTAPNVDDLVALEIDHPDKTLVWWTMGLARAVGTVDARSFNQQMRSYATSNDKILMDIADIESHRPDGSSCFDNQGNGIEALCSEYTQEINGGHLNALGKQRMAKAMWVLMARLAGWDGGTSPATSTPTQTVTGMPPTMTPTMTTTPTATRTVTGTPPTMTPTATRTNGTIPPPPAKVYVPAISN
jgi:hypothetical protein